ncbi:SO_0444 family Cu/Zn efflux transporter [Aliikangiella coralliicola]|uniref:Permease n=1 Tax=Aliikangiella coralliicola TaxID=2592383 RepID=A0A545UI52_9GAMM|nr:SO_0444 family Cu/Zn efflux transporter [Aliikangiella coralliicola]TQV89145.1 permease [Aliikangiella coralliicola]
MYQSLSDFLSNFLDLFQESAPWLLLGLLIAGCMKWLVPIELLKKHMGKGSIGAVIKAALIGAPLPLCSCGVIPAAVGLRRAGASKSASVSFLIATPETGVDSISVSYALLGPFMAIIRPISAILSAIYAGILVMFFTSDNSKAQSQTADGKNIQGSEPNNAHKQATSDCCEKVEIQPVESCCDKSGNNGDKLQSTEASIPPVSLQQRLVSILEFSSGKLLEDITKWLLLGLIIAAIIKTWVPVDFLTQWGSGLVAMLVMALVGVPMYICATASTPLAAGFLAAGVSPGAVLVFMLAGPATNLSTMGMIRQEMGSGVLVAYIAAILTASIGFGYFTNWAVAAFGFEIYQVAASTHQHEGSWVYSLSAIVLGAMMLRNAIKMALKSQKEASMIKKSAHH